MRRPEDTVNTLRQWIAKIDGLGENVRAALGTGEGVHEVIEPVAAFGRALKLATTLLDGGLPINTSLSIGHFHADLRAPAVSEGNPDGSGLDSTPTQVRTRKSWMIGEPVW